MPSFRYRALTAEGQVSTGVLAAGSRPEAITHLRTQGFRPLEIEVDHGGIKTATQAQKGRTKRYRVSKRDVLVFTSQLAALLKAGIVLSHALNILGEQTESDGLSKIIHTVREDIVGGASLSEALQKHPRQFSSLFCNMVRVGETGGVLDTVLKQLSGFMEAENTLVVFVGCASITILVTIVIPRLSAVFADFGNNLPWITRTMIGLSDTVLRFWWLILMGLAGLGYLFWQIKNHPAGREKLEKIKEMTPALGSMLMKAQVARFARTMGTLVKSGIPVLQALHLVMDTTASATLASCLRQVGEKVKKGEGLARPLKESGIFPPMVTNLIAVGEESGSLDEMLFQVADTYDIEVQHAIKRFITLFEPMVIILMAIGVGAVLVAFLLPILNISSIVG